MMHAITHLNPVLGVDIHIIQPPGPVPPVPIPHPYIGIVFDPADYVPIIGSTVSIHGLPRAIAGTAGKPVPSHIPIGGVFVKPPGNEDENFMGSSTVAFDGDAATYMALPVLSCQDVGMIAPPRLNPKKKTKMKSLLLPTSVVMPIPAGPPVLIGGPPTISLMALGMRFAMAGLGRGLRRLARSRAGRRAMAAFRRVRQRVFRNMRPGFLKCRILRAEPVDSVTGEVVVDQQDFSIPGRIPIEWNRHYGSRGERSGVCGHGWETPADIRLVFEDDGSVTFHDGTQALAYFDALPSDRPVLEPVDGGTLHRIEGYHVVRVKQGLDYYFAIPSEPAREVLVEYIMDPCRNFLRFVRDDNGLRAIEESAGRRIEVRSVGGLIQEMSLICPDSSEVRPLLRFEYGDSGDLVCVYDALDAPYRFHYDHHRLIQHTDRNGLSFYYAYDDYSPDGRCIHAWGDGGLYDYHFKFHDLEGRTEVTDSLGRVFNLYYDHRYLITQEVDPLGGKTLYEYDEAGRTTAVVDPGGHRTEYQYDERGNLLNLIRPDGKSIATEFDAGNKATCITDPNGAVWQQEWDERGLLIRQVTPLGAESRYEYDARGQLVNFVNPLKARTALAFDAYGNPTHFTDALGHVTEFTYDLLGNVTGKLDPLGHKTLYRYDAKGQLTDVRLPSGATIRCAYDAEGNLIRYVDENGAETKLEYAGLGEIARRIQPDGHIVEYHYDTEEQLIGVTNQRGETYHLKRDALGRIVEEVDYWGQARRYAYDASGYLTSSTDPLGRTIQYATDPLGRILKKTLHDGFVETFAYDANGNLVETKNPHIAVKREFDAEGRLTREIQGDFSIKNTYDATGNRVARETSLGNAVVYEFDALDQAVAVRINQEAPIRIERDAAGRIAREQLSPHLSRQFGYSADGYLTEQAVSANGSPIFATRFEYDPAGNLTQRSDSQYGVDVYRYDPLGRITEHLDPQRRITGYLNDPAGDRLRTRIVEGTRQRVAGGGVVEGEWSREGEYEGAYYRFDRAGNLVERRDGERDLRLVWDANQRLIESHADGTVTRYGYDPIGRRLFKETGDKRTLFYWDGDALVGEAIVIQNQPKEPIPAKDNVVAITERREKAQAEISQKVREYVYYPETFEPLALIEGTGTARHIYHYHNDLNGCPTRLTDASGEMKWGASYTAWGQISKLHVNEVDNPIRLQGQYADEETGFHFNRNRYFDPCTGQLTSADPLGLNGGLNNYEFGPNSLNWADPLGLSCKAIVHVEGQYEYFYRTMSKSDFADFLKTGRLRATTETFISPTRKFSEGYQGVLVKFQVASGTTEALRGMGVRAHGAKSAALLPDLPQVKSGWGKNKALFKPEGDQINIGLGKGKALDVFNDSIKGFEILGVS